MEEMIFIMRLAPSPAILIGKSSCTPFIARYNPSGSASMDSIRGSNSFKASITICFLFLFTNVAKLLVALVSFLSAGMNRQFKSSL